MTTLAIALVTNIQVDTVNSGRFQIYVNYCGIKAGQTLSTANIFMTNVDPTAAAVTLEAAIKQMVRDELVNNHGYTFGLFDDVRLIGSLL